MALKTNVEMMSSGIGVDIHLLVFITLKLNNFHAYECQNLHKYQLSKLLNNP
jgi:hypothetical protein